MSIYREEHMKLLELYKQLQEIASKLDIKVSEQNLRVTGVNAKSGLCKVKKEQVFIIDKHLPIREKVEVLTDCLRQMPLDDMYLMPAIRKYLSDNTVTPGEEEGGQAQ